MFKSKTQHLGFRVQLVWSQGRFMLWADLRHFSQRHRVASVTLRQTCLTSIYLASSLLPMLVPFPMSSRLKRLGGHRKRNEWFAFLQAIGWFSGICIVLQPLWSQGRDCCFPTLCSLAIIRQHLSPPNRDLASARVSMGECFCMGLIPQSISWAQYVKSGCC